MESNFAHTCTSVLNSVIYMEYIRLRHPKYMMYGELGRFHIEIDIKIRMVSFWPILLLGKETWHSTDKLRVRPLLKLHTQPVVSITDCPAPTDF
jgi:hypothetical protein